MRCDDLMGRIRVVRFHDGVRKRLGMKGDSEETATKLPLTLLSQRLNVRCHQIIMETGGFPVVDHVFRSYLSAASVP